MSSPRRAVQLAEHGLHAAVDVRAVVGVADRGVELCQLLLVLAATSSANSRIQAATSSRLTVAFAHAPHRRPGVLTGASQSRFSSSSSLTSVIEQPAISSDVMYEPTR